MTGTDVAQFVAPDWIAHHAAQTPDHPAMTDEHTGRHFTYREMESRCSRLAQFLRLECGIAPGDRVAVLAYNSTDILEVQFACRKLNAVFVPLNWRLAAAELAAIMENADAAVLIHGHEFGEVAASLHRGGLVPCLIETHDGAPSPYEDGIAGADPLPRSEPAFHDDIFAIMYTSGTTGRPKGVIITHRMTIFSSLNGMMKADVSRESVGLTFLPLFHVGGLFLMANYIFHAGGHNVFMRTFDVGKSLHLLESLGVTHAFGVPTNFAIMSELPDFERCDLSRLKCLMVGGAPSPLGLLEVYSRKNIRLQQGWGMTETTTLGTVLDAQSSMQKIGSAGRPVMHAELAILGEDFTPVSPGATGQLAIRGPTVTPGYWRQDDATRDAFHDGWFLTGDAAYVDEDGFLYVVDRWKDMYISGGENVYPAEVESVLQALPGVREAAVIGVPDDRWGEVGCAYLALEPDALVERADILHVCDEKLARFKHPKHVRIIDEIPHTAAGKISKPALRALYASPGTELT